MRKANSSIMILLVLLIAAGCAGKGSSKKGADELTDTLAVPDTGFTGIKKYYSNALLIKEITFKNGVREGEMKTYYQGGQLYHTIWYENGLREDSAKWYQLDGKLFRSTPYRHDTIDGTQIQYYRNGHVRARLYYIKGLRSTPFLEEYTQNGKLITSYPEIVYNITDNYRTNGKVRINLELTDKSRKVKFYRGEFTNGVFDTARCELISSINGKTYLDLKKSGIPQADYVGIVGAILTEFGNNYPTYKKIDLPYKDLK
jgi:antitoxin component YwqK of YwqJK toxin-antitoxin module